MSYMPSKELMNKIIDEKLEILTNQAKDFKNLCSEEQSFINGQISSLEWVKEVIK